MKPKKFGQRWQQSNYHHSPPTLRGNHEERDQSFRFRISTWNRPEFNYRRAHEKKIIVNTKLSNNQSIMIVDYV